MYMSLYHVVAFCVYVVVYFMVQSTFTVYVDVYMNVLCIVCMRVVLTYLLLFELWRLSVAIVFCVFVGVWYDAPSHDSHT